MSGAYPVEFLPHEHTDTLVVPHNLEAERAVLGAVLVNNDHFETAAALLAEETFMRDAHRRIWRAITGLAGRRVALDLVTVIEALKRSNDLEEVGGPAYVASLVDGIPDATNVPHYAGIVRDCATRRALMACGRSLIAAAANGQDEGAAIIDATVRDLIAINSGSQTGRLVEGPELARKAYDYIERAQMARKEGRALGVPTGFAELDEMTGGFKPGHLIVVAGRTSQGKTALATQFGLASGSAAAFTMEMEDVEMAVRAVGVLGEVSSWAISNGLIREAQHAKVAHGLEALAASGLAIDDTAAITLTQVRARARRRQMTVGLREIIVDYTQLMTPEGGRRRDSNREQEVAGLVRGLKAIAKDLQVPVVALSQLNRTAENERPTLAHLRESGAIEQDANVVILIHRPDGQSVAKEGDVELILAKNRGGPQGVVKLRWYPDQTRFADPSSAEPAPMQGDFGRAF